jgi:hypothetical protein
MTLKQGRALTAGGMTLLILAVVAILLRPAALAISPPPSVTATPLTIVPAPTLNAALKAPLFNATRLPPPPPDLPKDGEAAEPATPPAPPPIIAGVIVHGRGQGVALVKAASGETVTVRPGETVDGWSLIGIGQTSAIFEQAGRRETVNLDFRSSSTAGRASPPRPEIPSPPIPDVSPPPSSPDQ